MARIAAVPAALATMVCLVACSSDAQTGRAADPETTSPTGIPTTGIPTTGTPAPGTATPDTPRPGAAQTRAPRAEIDAVQPATAMAAVRHLAGDVGPRPGTSAAYHRAAAWVDRRLSALGWQVSRQSF